MYRSAKKNKFYITDVNLIKLPKINDIEGPFAVIGKHVKRTILDIMPDYSAENGFFGDHSTAPSAPYSTFLIFLNNHRIVYIQNSPGAPNIRSFSSTISHIITTYVSTQRSEVIDLLKLHNPNTKGGYYWENAHYETIKEFKEKYLDISYPYPETNIVAIESEKLVENTFKNISTIQSVDFKFYKPNNDPLNFDNFFESSYAVLEQTNSTSMTQTLHKPEKKDIIKNAVKTSNGKVDYKIKAKDVNNNPLTIESETVSEKLPITINFTMNVQNNATQIYTQVINKESVTYISDDNKALYDERIKDISKLIE